MLGSRESSAYPDFCFVGDVIKAIELLIDCESARGQIFNIGGEEEISILDLAQRVKTLSGSVNPVVKIPYDEAYPEGGYEDMRRRVPCLCKIRRLVGWLPMTSMEETLRETIDFQCEQGVRGVVRRQEVVNKAVLSEAAH